MKLFAVCLLRGCLVMGTWQSIFLGPSLACGLVQGATSEPRPHKFDEFKYTTSEDEHTRLDQFANQLKQQPKTKGVIIAYRGRVLRAGFDPKASARAAMARSYIAYVRGINFNRLITIDGGLRVQEMMELWTLPPGASLPTPSPTLPAAAGIYCPYLQVTGPAYIWAEKRTLTFMANVMDDATSTEPQFTWTTSSGQIVSGQGTRSISVQFGEKDYQPITATVEIGGYSSECNLAQSVRSPLALDTMPHLHRQYGDIGCDTENSILHEFALTLHQEPELRGFIVYYGGRHFRGRLPLRGEAAALAQRAKFYLVEIGQVDPDRIKLVDGGFREEWTAELWLSPSGAKEPVPSPIVARKEIRFRKGKLRRQMLSCQGFY